MSSPPLARSSLMSPLSANVQPVLLKLSSIAPVTQRNTRIFARVIPINAPWKIDATNNKWFDNERGMESIIGIVGHCGLKTFPKNIVGDNRLGNLAAYTYA